jgi:hypothetical protein
MYVIDIVLKLCSGYKFVWNIFFLLLKVAYLPHYKIMTIA